MLGSSSKRFEILNAMLRSAFSRNTCFHVNLFANEHDRPSSVHHFVVPFVAVEKEKYDFHAEVTLSRPSPVPLRIL